MTWCKVGKTPMVVQDWTRIVALERQRRGRRGGANHWQGLRHDLAGDVTWHNGERH